MGQNQRVSQLQEKRTNLHEGDLLYVSEKQKYGNYISKHIPYSNVFESVREGFSDDLDLLNDINENFLDNRKVTFEYKSNKKALEFFTGYKTLSVDASDFIEASMLSGVEYVKPNLILTFNLASGGTKQVSVDISDISILSAGHAISVDDRTISVLPDVISSDLSDVFASKTHTHSVSDITDLSIPTKTSELNNDSKFLSAEDFKMEYSTVDSKLSLSVGLSTILTAEIQSGGKTYTAGRGIVLSGDDNTVINTAADYTTYENVKNNLSNDGYCVIFRDWIS